MHVFAAQLGKRKAHCWSAMVPLRYRRYPDGNAKKPISNNRFSSDAPLQGTRANTRNKIHCQELDFLLNILPLTVYILTSFHAIVLKTEFSVKGH